jgi:hypothetical protein
MKSKPKHYLLAIAGAALTLIGFFSICRMGGSLALQWPWHIWYQALFLMPWIGLCAGALLGCKIARFGTLVDGAMIVYVLTQAISTCTAYNISAAINALPIAIAPVGIAYAVGSCIINNPETPLANRIQQGLSITLSGICLVSLTYWLSHTIVPQLYCMLFCLGSDSGVY